MRRSAPLVSFAGLLVALPALGQTTPPDAAPHRVFGVQQDAPAAPAPPPRELVRLDYVAPPGCPDEQALRSALASRMGYDPVSAGAARLLRVVLARDKAGFVARAELRDATGRVTWSREPLRDADCRALVGGMGLAIKFAVDPYSSATELSVAPAPAPIVISPAPENPPQLPPRDRLSPASISRPKVRFGVRAAGAVGTAPAPTGTLSADLGAGWTYFSVAIEGRGDVPITGAVSDGVQLRTRIAAGSLVPCGHYRWFFGCGVVSAGALWAEGVNTLQPAVGTAVYAVAGPRAGVEWEIPKLPSLALRLSVDLLVNLHPIIARVDGAHVWPTPPVAGLLGGGLVVKI
jgi:hypothetical protein